MATEKRKIATALAYRLAKDWIPYDGPQGGEGWQHVETGEVRYTDDPPGDVHDDYHDEIGGHQLRAIPGFEPQNTPIESLEEGDWIALDFGDGPEIVHFDGYLDGQLWYDDTDGHGGGSAIIGDDAEYLGEYQPSEAVATVLPDDTYWFEGDPEDLYIPYAVEHYDAHKTAAGDRVFDHLSHVHEDWTLQNAYASIQDTAGRDGNLQPTLNIGPEAVEEGTGDTIDHELGHLLADAYGYNVTDPDANADAVDEFNGGFMDAHDDDLLEDLKLVQHEDADVPDEVVTLIDAANETFERVHQQAKEFGASGDWESEAEADGPWLAEANYIGSRRIRRNYAFASAHETLAMTMQVLRSNEVPLDPNLYHHHDDLLRAALDVIDPSDRMQRWLNYMHDRHGDVFEDTPYPDQPEIPDEFAEYEEVWADLRADYQAQNVPDVAEKADREGIVITVDDTPVAEVFGPGEYVTYSETPYPEIAYAIDRSGYMPAFDATLADTDDDASPSLPVETVHPALPVEQATELFTALQNQPGVSTTARDLTKQAGEDDPLPETAVPAQITIKWGGNVVGFARIQDDDLLTAYTGSNAFLNRIVNTTSTETYVTEDANDPYDDGIIDIDEERDISPQRRMRELILVLHHIPGVRVTTEQTTKAAILSDLSTTLKTWVPYRGPRDGTGWRNTATEQITYDDEKPTPEADPEELANLSWDDVEDSTIHQTEGWFNTPPAALEDGDVIQYHTPDGYKWEGYVAERTDNRVLLETDSERQVPIPVNEQGEVAGGGTIRTPQMVFFGTGAAGVEHSWLPDDRPPTDEQVYAEAVRSAAATDGPEDTAPLEGFAAHAQQQGAGREQVADAVGFALEQHPVLSADRRDEILAAADATLATKSDSAIQTAYQSVLRKDWVPYEGPQGGEGWIDPAAGEVRYTDEPPGDREAGAEGQTQTALETGIEPEFDLDEPRWLDDEAARAAVYQALGEDAYNEILARFNAGHLTEYESDVFTQYRERGVEGDEFDLTAEMWLGGAEEWIADEGTGKHAAALQRKLERYDTTSPWGPYTDDFNAPDHLNPERCDEVVSFRDAGIDGGISAQSMYIGQRDSVNRVFYTNVNDKVGDSHEDGLEMQAAADTARFLSELDFSVPDHHYEEGQFLAVAEADGEAVADLHRRAGETLLAERNYLPFAAAQILAGNHDAHTGNVFVDFMANEPVVIDLDLAGNDFTDAEYYLRDALGQLFDTGVELGLYEPYDSEAKDRFMEKVRTEVEALATHDDMDDALAAIEDDTIREAVASNVEAARTGDLVTPETNMRSML